MPPLGLRTGSRLGAATAAVRRMLDCRRGNVSVIFAFAVTPMLLVLGAGVDYSLAMKRQARMNAAADAAALDAVTPTMMRQSADAAKAAATAFFSAQVASIVGASYKATDLSVTVTDTSSSGAVKRTASVAYVGASTNTFASILSIPTLSIKGSSTAAAAVSPDIDFYLMLDTSPSMAIAATLDGIATMVANTKTQSGCAFACHETNPAADDLGNPGGEDNYALARSLGVLLRIDMVSQAVQNLMTTAAHTEISSGAVYRMAGYTFDVNTSNLIPLTSNLATAQSEASNLQMLTVYDENNLTKTNNNSDQDTNFDQAFSTVNSAMPAPGNGTKTSGDSPQEVLFLVTDGVADAAFGGHRVFTPFGPSTTWCDTIKARKIRIAVLYTTYNPLPTNSFYNSNIKPLQPSIGTTAQACASPGLFFQVDTGGDISAAMTTLFSTAVASAHLVH